MASEDTGGGRRQMKSPAPFSVQPMSLEDLDEVVRVEQAIYPFPWSRGNFRDSLRAGYDAWRFLDDAGQMLGYSVLMWAPDEVHLLNLSIVLACQGQGLGERCLGWLADDVQRRGATALLLEVRPSNERALRLYERVGLQRIGLRRGYYPGSGGQPEDAVVMRSGLPLAGGGAIAVRAALAPSRSSRC